MARIIATPELVAEAAEALLAEGKEPTTLNVCKVTGGSHSTVIKGLVLWQKKKTDAAEASAAAPPDVDGRALEFGRAIWARAYILATSEFRAGKDEANSNVSAATLALQVAEAEIERLEEVERQLELDCRLKEGRIHGLELDLSAEQGRGCRLDELERELRNCREKLESANSEVTKKSVEIGRLTGEAESLRAQLEQVMSTFNLKTAVM